jgi:hypothetical protein
LLALAEPGEQNNIDENLHENLVFDFGRRAVHGLFCSGQTELQQNRQELSDE